MISLKYMIGLAVLATLLSASGVLAESQVYPFFYPLERARGVYYAPGTPVLKAVGPAETVELGPFEAVFGPDTITPHGGRSERLLEGAAVPIGVVGNHCQTPATTCLLYHSSVQGGGCACEVGRGWRRGVVGP